MANPGSVEQFLDSSIDSVEQCQMLMTIRNVGNRWWSAKDLARELYLTETSTARDLEDLATRGLLEVRLANDLHYRFAPASPELRSAVEELADAYRDRRAAVLSFIVNHKGRALRHFAEAFRFRKDGP